MSKIKRLTDKQHMAISLLAEGMTKERTAEIVGVTRQTIYNWMKNDHFNNTLTQAIIDVERAMRAERIQKARKVAGEALQELLRRLEDAEKREDISVRELKDIYRDVIATMNAELKNDPVLPAARDEDDVEATPTVTGDLLDNDSFREDLRKLLIRHSE